MTTRYTQVYFAAAKKVSADDGNLDHEISRLLDATVPHRRQAVEIEVIEADELELARRDAAAARLDHKIGSPIEQVWDPTLTWEAISWLRSVTRLPIIAQGRPDRRGRPLGRSTASTV